MNGRRLTRWLAGLFVNDATRRALAESLADTRYELRTAAGKRAAVRARLSGVAAALRVLARGLFVRPLDEPLFFGLQADIRHGWRRLRRAPLFTSVAVMILGFGIGANIVIFSVFNGILFREIPLRNIDRLVSVGRIDVNGVTLFRIDRELMEMLRREPPAPFDTLFESSQLQGALTDADATSVINGEAVSSQYFRVFEVQPFAGRLLEPGDDRESSEVPVVLSARFWRRRFHGDPSVIGRRLTLSGQGVRVIGITPPEFRGAVAPTLMQSDIWAPAWARPRLGDWGTTSHRLFGRLRPTATEADAAAAISRIAPTTAAGEPVVVRSGREAIIGDRFGRVIRAMGGGLIVMSGLVFVIACGNLASLLLARGVSRSSEVAVRLATGASRLRIVRLFLAETLPLIAGGAIVSAIMTIAARWAVAAIPWPPVQGIDIALDPSPDYHVMLFGFGVVSLATLVIGVIPAWRIGRLPVIDVMKAGGAGSASARRSRGTKILVSAQVGASLMLLLGASLYMRSALYLDRQDPGFETSRAATVTMDLRLSRIDEGRGRRIFDRALAVAASLPGVESAALVSGLPTPMFALTSGSLEASADGVPRPPLSRGKKISTPFSLLLRVSPGAFHVLGIRLLEGRDFRDADDVGAPRVAIISQSLAKLIWPGQSPIGRRLALGPTPLWVEVIGVAADTRVVPKWNHATLTTGLPLSYVPVKQQYGDSLSVIVRSAPGVTPASLLPGLQRTLNRAEPSVAFVEGRTLADAVSAELLTLRVGALAFFTLGGLGFGIAMLGVYGMVSHAARLRIREFGIRKALGASSFSLFAIIVRYGLRLIGPGVVIPIGVILFVARVLRGRLVGVGPRDPVTFIGMPALLLVAAIVACLVAARRAARVDPNIVLREL